MGSAAAAAAASFPSMLSRKMTRSQYAGTLLFSLVSYTEE
jgi:hypothetical protein